MVRQGQIDVHWNVPAQLQALLYDFDVDSDTVKLEHNHWIRANVMPYRTRTMTDVIIGLASRTGPNAHNMDLSKRRADNVSRQIYLLEPSLMMTETNVAFGEEAARIAGVRDGVEDARWRGVLITLFDPSTLPVPLKPNPPGQDGKELGGFESKWGDEEKKERKEKVVPANYSVNVVRKSLSYKQETPLSAILHFYRATIDYEWGPTQDSVEVYETLKVTDFPEEVSRKTVSRHEADNSKLLTPPDPELAH